MHQSELSERTTRLGTMASTGSTAESLSGPFEGDNSEDRLRQFVHVLLVVLLLPALLLVFLVSLLAIALEFIVNAGARIAFLFARNGGRDASVLDQTGS